MPDLVSFRGRIGRAQFALAFFVVLVLLLMLHAAASKLDPLADPQHVGRLAIAIATAVFLVSIVSLHARRLHDVGATGWLALLFFTPVLNLMLTFPLLILRGQPESNRYGPPPGKPLNRELPVSPMRLD